MDRTTAEAQIKSRADGLSELRPARSRKQVDAGKRGSFDLVFAVGASLLLWLALAIVVMATLR